MLFRLWRIKLDVYPARFKFSLNNLSMIATGSLKQQMIIMAAMTKALYLASLYVSTRYFSKTFMVTSPSRQFKPCTSAGRQ